MEGRCPPPWDFSQASENTDGRTYDWYEYRSSRDGHVNSEICQCLSWDQALNAELGLLFHSVSVYQGRLPTHVTVTAGGEKEPVFSNVTKYKRFIKWICVKKPRTKNFPLGFFFSSPTERVWHNFTLSKIFPPFTHSIFWFKNPTCFSRNHPWHKRRPEGWRRWWAVQLHGDGCWMMRNVFGLPVTTWGTCLTNAVRSGETSPRQ